MTGQLGEKLREWRKARGLTLEEAAGLAGIGRVTLNRWETNTHQPRLAELEALLTALGVDARQRQQTLSLVDAPRGQAQVRNTLARAGEQAGIGPIPNGGDLLRAMRRRRHLSTSEAASRLGVTARTLQRWEAGKILPPLEALEALLSLFQATPGERVALLNGNLFLAPPLRVMLRSKDDIQRRLEACCLTAMMSPEDPLNDLGFLTLATEVWPLAARGGLGREWLAAVYANYASYLAGFHRFAEAEAYANRVLDLQPEKRSPGIQEARAAIVLAQAGVYRRVEPVPRRGLELLRMWLPIVKQPEYRAWILSDMAEYLAVEGAVESALQYAEEACRAVENHPNPSEYRLRCLDLAHLQVQFGRAEKGLSLTDYRAYDGPFRRGEIALLWAEAFWKMEERAEAQNWLQRACVDIDQYALNHLRPSAEKLSLHL